MIKTRPRARKSYLSPSHKRAARQERDLAKQLGGRVTPGSGNLRIKGDVRVTGFTRVECKTTKRRSFSVNMDMLDKIESAAVSAQEIPFMEVELELGARRFYVVPDWAFHDLMAELISRQQVEDESGDEE